MASAPQNQLPLFYNSLEPLSSQAHGNYRLRQNDTAKFLVGSHAIPVTVDEFALLQRFLPIVFTIGDESIPIALMGLNEGVNVFIDDDGKLTERNLYIPAYVRRYPFMLARLRPDAEEMTLCFDPTSDRVGDFEEGEKLFTDGEASETTKGILAYNESFEQAGARTAAFMKEVNEMGLLMDGEISITPEGRDRPFIYRGFRMVDEKKLSEVRGDQLRRMNQSGMLPLLYAHLFSLSLMREIFGRQMELGKMPQPELAI